MANGRDVDSLLASVNAASAKGRATWIALLSFGSYLAVAVGATTHRDLFLESPISLPILGVDLPLIAFYIVAPFLFLIMHLYLLVNLYVLGRRIHLFEERLEREVPVRADQERVRASLDPFIVLLHVAGRISAPVPRLLLALTVWITVIAGPVILLIAFQVQFLAYHSEPVTWAHRGLILADIAFLWALWPSTIHDSGRFWPAIWSPFRAFGRFLRQVLDSARATVETIRDGKLTPWQKFRLLQSWQHEVSRSTQRAAAAPLAVCGLFVSTGFVAVFSLLVATVPDEDVEERIRSSGWFELTERDGRAMWWPTATLFEGELNEARARLNSIFSRSLVLPDADLISMSEDELAKVEHTLTLRDRNLRYANLIGAELRKVEFIVPDLRRARLDGAKLTGARFACAARAGGGSLGSDDCPQLQGASLGGARLQGASLDEAQLQGAWLDGAELQGASLDRAQLQGASLNGAALQDASLDRAQLQGASLDVAWLQGASLNGAALQGASLFGAWLQGASLDGAALQGASLDGAWLQGASLDGAALQGASLDGAALQGASLNLAQLQGASLNEAELQGASLGGAQLQGASLDGAQLQGASLDRAGIWRADIRGASETTLLFCIGSHFNQLTAENFDELDAGLDSIPEGERRQQAQARVKVLRAPAEAVDELALKMAWNETSCRQYDPQQSDQALADLLIAEVICHSDMIVDGTAVGAFAVAGRIFQEFLTPRPYHAFVARAVLDNDQCEAVREVLSATEIAAVRSFLEEAKPTPDPASPPVEPAKPAPELVRRRSSLRIRPA
jgi:uncharacterized protein YjbI with pentapeptide repeats